MALALLPQEVLSVVCRWLGLTFNEDHPDESDNIEIRYDNTDFSLTPYKVIYFKTMHDAGIRFGCQLEDLEVDMSERSLCNLLNLTTNPTFRDKMRTLSLGQWNNLDRQQIEAGKQIDHQESMDTYLCSPELVYLLADGFRRLRKARHLDDVLVSSDLTHGPIFRALHIANVPEKMLAISVNPKRLVEQGYGAPSASSTDYRPYIRMLKVHSESTDLQYIPRAPGQSRVAAFRERLVENLPGFHVRSFRHDYPDFTQFVKDLPEIEGLHLLGCQSHPRLRFCNACRDLFATNSGRCLQPPYAPYHSRHVHQRQQSPIFHQNTIVNTDRGDFRLFNSHRRILALDLSRPIKASSTSQLSASAPSISEAEGVATGPTPTRLVLLATGSF
ncbi:hypothetical protein FB567DRAFT_603738 [Paraphoma chrysanthemicola]|uniref:Uncharacterized protein n=1 Tax=Paraphoma chrysanthemicola TaxID=798071 RepID=A0A8K0R682_9PLEO|nr:hypothetical protein FB567DRAFT_603738 [Paraphoma chrysanthemicola]